MIRESGFVALVCSLLMAPVMTIAETTLNVRNAGGQRCENYHLMNTTEYLQWVAGYATAVSQANSVIDVYPTSETNGLLEVAVMVCREQPGLIFQQAVMVALSRLKVFWITSPELVSLEINGTQTTIYKQAIKPLQAAMVAKGGRLEIDGVFGRRTAQLLIALQENIGIAPEQAAKLSGITFYALTKP